MVVSELADFKNGVRSVLDDTRRLIFDLRPMTLDDLGPKISAKLENKTNKEVYMRADTRANYGVVMDAIDNIRTSGTDTLGVLTDQPNNGNASTKNGTNTTDGRCPAHEVNVTAHTIQQAAAAIAAVTQALALSIANSGVLSTTARIASPTRER